MLAHPAGALVGGTTAWFIDQKAAISAQMPLALAILVCVTLGTLFLMTGSVVLPLMALLMNLLTVAVGAGLLVLIFQDGHLSSLMGFSPIGGLEESNLVLLFTVAFALSTDYGVFLFARIKEAHDGGLATREAVAQGLERTGRPDRSRRTAVLRRGRRVRDLAHLLHQAVRPGHRAGGRDRRDVRTRAARARADGQARRAHLVGATAAASSARPDGLRLHRPREPAPSPRGGWPG